MMATERLCRISGCTKVVRGTTICSSHKHRIERYGDAFTFPIRATPLIEVFDQLAAIENDECVRWPGKPRKGYGYVTLDGSQVGVHVLVCIRRYGDPPSSKHEVAHSCRNRDCMNYRHLRWSTRRENILDRVRDGTDNRGEKHPMAKLTVDGVLDIRKRCAEGSTQQALATKYGVSSTAIKYVVRRVTWTWL